MGVDGWLNPGYLLDVERNLPLADEAYAYELALAPRGDSGFTGGRELNSGPVGDLVSSNRVRFRADGRDSPQGGKEVRFTGRFDFGLLGPTDIEIEHAFRRPTPNLFEEEFGCATASAGMSTRSASSASAFARRSFDRDSQSWLHGADRQTLVPVPHRRRWGQIIDHQATAYTMSDLIPATGAEDLARPRR